MNVINIRWGTWFAVILLPFVAGGIQRKSFIGALAAEGGWIFHLEDEQLFLIEAQAASKFKRELQAQGGWAINAPTIRSPSGDRFLSVDPNGVSDRVRLDRKKGEHSEWNFHIEKRETPKKAGVDYREGDSRYTFRLSVANGPFKGWWVGAEDAADGVGKADSPATNQPPRRRIVKLFADPKKALLFKYHEASYSVHHK